MFSMICDARSRWNGEMTSSDKERFMILAGNYNRVSVTADSLHAGTARYDLADRFAPLMAFATTAAPVDREYLLGKCEVYKSTQADRLKVAAAALEQRVQEKALAMVKTSAEFFEKCDLSKDFASRCKVRTDAELRNALLDDRPLHSENPLIAIRLINQLFNLLKEKPTRGQIPDLDSFIRNLLANTSYTYISLAAACPDLVNLLESLRKEKQELATVAAAEEKGGSDTEVAESAVNK